MYRLEASPAAIRDIEKLKERIQEPDFERLKNAVRSLADEPRPMGVRKLGGPQNVYRIRVGSYGIIYDVY